MAGGTWTAQNKVRPGAYINFESVPTPASNVGSRGIVTIPAPLSWGAEDALIPLYSQDLLGGKSLSKIGLTAYDKESLIFREALSGAYLALVYRSNSGGTKATGMAGDLQATARYTGTLGNRISVAVQENSYDSELLDVITYLDGNEKDRQTVDADGQGLGENEFASFRMVAPELDPEQGPQEAKLEATAGVTLSGGEDGTADPAAYTKYFSLADQALWSVMAIPDDTEAVKKQAMEYIRSKRETAGRKCQVVLVDYARADYEGVISVDQGYVNSAGEQITPAIFTATVAGMTAGAEINQSNTFRVINSADSIINPIPDEEVEAALKAGRFVLTRRQDGEIVVEQDINTLHRFTPDKDYAFSKNRVIRVLDDIGNQIRTRFENAYIGKVDNNDLGRSVFRADIIHYLNELQELGAVQNFDPAADITVSQGGSVDAVRADLWVQPVDSMEKLYLQVMVSGGDR